MSFTPWLTWNLPTAAGAAGNVVDGGEEEGAAPPASRRGERSREECALSTREGTKGAPRASAPPAKGSPTPPQLFPSTFIDAAASFFFFFEFFFLRLDGLAEGASSNGRVISFTFASAEKFAATDMRLTNSMRVTEERASPSAVRSMRSASTSTNLTRLAALCSTCKAPRTEHSAVRRSAAVGVDIILRDIWVGALAGAGGP